MQKTSVLWNKIQNFGKVALPSKENKTEWLVSIKKAIYTNLCSILTARSEYQYTMVSATTCVK